jgi:hypothetical protein
MTETPPTKPPLPPLRERLKLPDNCVDVTGQHKGEVFVLTNPGSVDGSARGEWQPLAENPLTSSPSRRSDRTAQCWQRPRRGASFRSDVAAEATLRVVQQASTPR